MSNIKPKLTVVLLLSSALVSQAGFANNDSTYLPYLQVGGTQFLNGNSSSKQAAGFDLFMPLWQLNPSHLLFTHIRTYDRTGRQYELNAHVGYRYLSEEKNHLYGIYGAFDRKRSRSGNYFNQLTFGVEGWFKKLFIGGNLYQPIGRSTRPSYTKNTVSKTIVITDYHNEKALGGFNAEVGYEFIKGLIGYVGGYYFHAKDVDSVYGPALRLSYDFSLDGGKKALGVFDKFGLEVGVQHDKVRGTIGYIGVNFRIGLMLHRSADLQGAARHMVDLVRRDIDIIVFGETSTKKETRRNVVRSDLNIEPKKPLKLPEKRRFETLRNVGYFISTHLFPSMMIH